MSAESPERAPVASPAPARPGIYTDGDAQYDVRELKLLLPRTAPASTL